MALNELNGRFTNVEGKLNVRRYGLEISGRGSVCETKGLGSWRNMWGLWRAL